MKIRLTDNWANGEDEYQAGTQLGLDDEVAKALIAEGKAVDVVAEIKAQKEAEAQDKRTANIVEKAVSAVLSKIKPNEKLVTVLEPMAKEEDPAGGFKNFSEFLNDVVKAGVGKGRVPQVSPKLAKWQEKISHIMQEGDDEQGGFLVPVEFKAQLLKHGLEKSVVYGNARKLPMARNRLEIPGVDVGDHSVPNFFGGATIYWEDEAAQKTTSKPKFYKVQMHLHKLIGLVPVTDELLEDSAVSIPSTMTEIFGSAIRWVADDAFINGNGVGIPMGIINCAAFVTVARAGAGAIAMADVNNMMAQHYVENSENVVWLANKRTFPQLATLAVGTVPVWVPAAGGIASVSPKPLGTLYGYPVLFTEKCPALGAVGDLILADLSQYIIGEKAKGLEVATSIHLWFDYDLTAFRFVLRIDGQCAWRQALTEKDGTAVSPFVGLTV